MDNKEIRRLNLRALIDTQYDGVDRRMAVALERQPNEISRVFSNNEKAKRNIGDNLARQIEQVCNKPRGWLDLTHPELWAGDEGYVDTMNDLVDGMNAEQITKLIERLATRLVGLNQK